MCITIIIKSLIAKTNGKNKRTQCLSLKRKNLQKRGLSTLITALKNRNDH